MAPDTLSALFDYLLRLLPILGLLIAALYSTPASRPGLRVLILILAFICLRDQMTPAGLWALGEQPPLRFHTNPWVLLFLGSASIALLILIRRFLTECWQLVVGFKTAPVAGIAAGCLAGCLIGLPIRLHFGLPLAPLPWLLAFATLALAGNALEEVLFRGMLQGWLERRMPAWYAAIGSALAFCACHVYLAFILTNAGWPVLAFTLMEGMACALVRLKWGTWPAALAHGTAILLIGAPLQR